MANKTWIGGVTAVPMVWKGSITTTTAGHTYIVTVTDEFGASTAFSYALVAGDTTVTIAAASFVTAWNLIADGIIASFTASSSVGQVILTQDTGGIPYTLTPTGTGTWSGTGNTTAPQSPNDYSIANNWAEGAVPIATDNVFISGTKDILYGLNQSAVEIGNFTVLPTCTAAIGRPQASLQIDVANASTAVFGGTGLAYIDVGASAISPRVDRTAFPAAQGAAGLYLAGSAFSTVNILGGVVRMDAGSTWTTITVYAGATLIVPAGATLTTITNYGTLTLGAACTTLNNIAGNCVTENSGAYTTVNCDGGKIVSNSTGTIGTLNSDGGEVDLLQNHTARTITNLAMRGGKVRYEPSVVTITNPITSTVGVELKSAA